MSAVPGIRETRSTCPYCGVGCGVVIESVGSQITGVRGDPDHPANFGRLCSKGSTLHLTAAAEIARQTRLLQPMRRTHRGEKPRAISWATALDFAVESFAQIIREYGPDSVGFYVSGQLLTEDYYVFNKLAKGLIGTNNIDTNSRLCMSSAVAGYKQTLGADAPPACYEDIDHAQCLFIAGSNTAWAHPVLFRRIEDAKAKNPALKIIVADPRKTDTASMADLFLPIQPGTDVALFNGMLHVMLWEGWTDAPYIAAHTSGFDALKATVRDDTPDRVAQTCGIDKSDLLLAARWFAGMHTADGPAAVLNDGTARLPTLSLYCQGLNQSSSGTAKNAALINLHLACGQIGKPGAGPFSLTGQPNAMGGREVGGLANLLSAHRDLANPVHRAEVEALWGLDKLGRNVPATPGKTAVEMFQAAADGQIKALWIACTNPAQSMPDQATARRALERAQIVIVQEAFASTATCAYADLLLPATTWGEKEGTVTNSERRISRVRAAVSPPSETKHDWQIAVEFAQRLEAVLAKPQSTSTLFNYNSPEQVWNEHRESTRGRDLDITGLSYALIEKHGAQQWPSPDGTCTSSYLFNSNLAQPDLIGVRPQLIPNNNKVTEINWNLTPIISKNFGKARLYEDGIYPTPDGRARFVNTVFKPVAEARSARYPFALNTGRLRDQWHGMSRTGTLGRLFGHVSEPSVQLNPQDMARRLLKAGDFVHVTSTRGSIILPLQASADVGMSQAFVAMHWGEEFVSGKGSTGTALSGVNSLTTPAYCPDSKQPELKHTPVKILKAELPWSLLAMAWLPDTVAYGAREQLRALMNQFQYAACVPFGRERCGVLFRAAHDGPASAELLAQIEAILQLDAPDALRYVDKPRGQRRTARLVKRITPSAGSGGSDEDANTGTAKVELQGVLLAGDTSAEAWIKTVLQDQLPAQTYGRMLLAPGVKPPVAIVAKGAQVCTCFNVSEPTIAQFLAALCADEGARNDATDLAALQAGLQCGTNCGSCLPELKRMVRASRPVQAA